MDTPDRERNLMAVTSYLLHNFDCPIIITEADVDQKALNFIPKDERVTYRFCKLNSDDPFHRTKYLNEMTHLSTTDCVANYDVDVMFHAKSIEYATNLLMNDGADVIYPFGRGEYDQVRVFCTSDLDAKRFIEEKYHYGPHTFPQGNIPNSTNDPLGFQHETMNFSRWTTMAGHCQLFKKESYLSGYLENENFISWGPEDAERLHRFETLGYDVRHLKGNLVYHLEHAQSVDSGRSNPHLSMNEILWDSLSKMSKSELTEYYEAQTYMKKYKTVTA